MDREIGSDFEKLKDDGQAAQLIQAFNQAEERGQKLKAALDLASYLIHRGRYHQAQQALNIGREYIRMVSEEARWCRMQSNILYRQGKLGEAAALLERSASSAEMEHHHLALFGLRLEQARIRFRQGYLEQARDHALQAELQLTAVQDNRQEVDFSAEELDLAWADLYHIKALLEGATGNHQASFSWYEREIEILERLNNRAKLGIVYNNLSGLLKIKGDFYGALEHQLKAHQIAQASKDQLSLAISHNNLAEIFYDLGDYSSAREHYQIYLAINKRISNRLGDSFGLAGLGRIARDEGDVDRAEEYWQQALTAAREVNSLSRQASILTELGELYCQQGRCNEAEQALNQAVALCLESQSFNSQRHQLLDARIKLQAATILKQENSEELARIEESIMEVLEQPVSLEGEEAMTEADLLREGYYLLARAQQRQGKISEAKRSGQRAWTAVEGVLDKLPPEMKEQYIAKPEIKRLKSFLAELS